jgi:ribosomal protein L33
MRCAGVLNCGDFASNGCVLCSGQGKSDDDQARFHSRHGVRAGIADMLLDVEFGGLKRDLMVVYGKLRFWVPSFCRFFYTARKNPSSIQHKLAFMKVSLPVAVRSIANTTACSRVARCSLPLRFRVAQFDPIVRQHVLFTEVRISRAKK